MNGGDLGGGESEGELAPFVFFIFPSHLPFWVFPSQLPNKGKNAQIKKETKCGRHDPILTHPVCDHKGDAPNGGAWGGGFSFGWMDVGAKKKN